MDLRWGITDEQKAEGRVLPICLAEIVGCRPYFIGVLGERYGWVLDEIPAGLAEQETWLADARGRSVTELEILHGVLNDPGAAGHCFFYFRDPTALDRLPRGACRADFEAESPEYHQRLNALKDRIRSSGLPVHENFQSAADLGRLVLADMTEIIDRLFPAGQVTNSLDRETAEHAAFVRSRAQVYIGRAEDFGRLDAYADDTGGPPLVVLGESGTGKSALLANWALQRRETQSDEMVLCHFVGAGPASTDWVLLLRRIMGELRRHFGLAREVPQRPSEIVREFGDWLRLTGGRRVLLVVDALNQLEDRDRAHDLGWLPETFPENVRVIVSTLPGRCLDEVQRRGWSTHEVRPLDTPERERLCVAYLRQYAKTLAGAPLARIVAAPQTANALFLRALLDELRVFGTFERLDRQIDGYLQAKDPEELFDRILTRCEADCDRERPGLVRDSMRHIWAARRGLAEAELLELLGTRGQPVPRVYWSNLALTIDSALVSRSGLLDFSHDYFRRAVERRYLPRARQKRTAHRQLANYFERREFGRTVSRRRLGGPYWLGLALFLAFAGGLGWGTREALQSLMLPPAVRGHFLGTNLPLLGLLAALAGVLTLLIVWSAARALSGFRWCLRRMRLGRRPRVEPPGLADAASNARARGELPWQLVRAEEWWRLYDVLARADFLRRAGAVSLLELADLSTKAEAGTMGYLAGWWARTAEMRRVHRDIFGGRPIDAYRPVLDTLGGAADHTAAIAAVLLECGYPRESLVLSDRLAGSQRRFGDVGVLAGALLHHADGLNRQGLTIAELGMLRNLEGLLQGTDYPALLARCLYAQAGIFQSRHETVSALDRLDQADRMNPAGPTDLDRLRGRAVRASCLADAADVDGALLLLRDTELALLDGGGGPADLLAVLSRQYRILAAAIRPDEAAEAEQRVRRLCSESGIDPTSYLDPLPPYRQLAKLHDAATAWGRQGNRKFRAFALAEAARTLAVDAGFPLAARPLLTEAERLARRLRDSTFTPELADLRQVIDKEDARHGPSFNELARPRSIVPALAALLFACVGGSFALLFGAGAWEIGTGDGPIGPTVFVLVWFGLIAWLWFAAALRRLHGLYVRPSILATPTGLLLKGWGLSAAGFSPFAFLRPFRRIELRPVLWEALVSVGWKKENIPFFGPTLILQLDGAQVIVGKHFHKRPKLLIEAVVGRHGHWEAGQRFQGKRTPAALAPVPARWLSLPDFGTLALVVLFAVWCISKAIEVSSKDGPLFSPESAIFLIMAYATAGALTAGLGLLALLGFGRRHGTLRKGFAALGVLFGFLLTMAGPVGLLSGLTTKQWSLAELDQIVALYPRESRAWLKRGEARLKAGDREGGIADLTEAIRLDSDSANALKSRGIALAGKGDPGRAAADYTAAIHMNPKDPELYNYRGLAHLALGDRDAALLDFTAAVRLDPNLYSARYNRGHTRLQLGETDAALEDLNEAVRLNPKKPDALANRGIAWRSKKDYPKAIADFTEALRLDPKNAATYNLRGAALTVQGDRQAALADFDTSLQLDPKQRQVLDNRGETRFALRDYKGAVADFGQCIELAPGDAELYLKRAEALVETGEYEGAVRDLTEHLRLKPSAAATVLARRGIARRLQKDYAKAVADFTEALRLEPKNAATYNLRGAVLSVKGDHRAALADFDRSLQLDPKKRQVLDNRGEARFSLQDYAGAAADFGQCIALAPSDAEAYLKRAGALLDAGEYEGAVRDFTEYLNLKPSAAATVLPRRGVAWRLKKDYPKALADFTEALRLDPRNAATYNLRGAALAVKGDQRAALADFDFSLEIDPKQRQVLDNRGETRFAVRDYKGAAADFGQCIELAPGDAKAYLKRAGALLEIHEYDGAVRDFTEHLRLNPSAAATVLPRRGIVWRLKKDYPKAIADFTEALRLDPRNAATYNLRGAALAVKGDHQAALADFDRSLELDPKQRQVLDNRGETRFAVRDYKGAAADFGRCIELAPGDAEAYFKRADSYQSDGRHKEAAADYTMAIGKGKKGAPTFNNRGLAFLESGNGELAIADFTEAIRLDERFAAAYLNRGISLARKNEPAAAVEDFDQYVRLKPGVVRGFRERGTSLIRLGRWRPAAEDFAAVMKLEPRSFDDGIVHTCLLLKLDDQKAYRETCADLLRRFGAVDDSSVAQYLTHCVSLTAGAVPQPRLIVSLAEKNLPRVKMERAAYLRWYGAALYRAGDYKEAIRQLKAAVAAQPKTGAETIDWLFLALAHAKTGNETEAKSWYEKASQRIDAVRNAKSVPATAAAWATQFQNDLLRDEAAALLSRNP